MTDEELLREAARVWAERPRASDLKAAQGQNPRWVTGEFGGKATPDQLPPLAVALGVNLDTLKEWITLAATVEPELRDMMSWAAFRAITKRRDWRKLIKPGLSERDARRIAGHKKVNAESVKRIADRVERDIRNPKVRQELVGREDLARSVRARIDFVEDEDRAQLRRLEQNATASKKNQTADAALDDLMVKTMRTALEIETAVALIKSGEIKTGHPERRKEIHEMFDRLGNAGFDGLDALKDAPQPPDAVDVDPAGPAPELGPG